MPKSAKKAGKSRETKVSKTDLAKVSISEVIQIKLYFQMFI